MPQAVTGTYYWVNPSGNVVAGDVGDLFNAHSCGFTASGVRFGFSGYSWGKGAAEVGVSTAGLGLATGNLPLTAFGAMLGGGGGLYATLSITYAAFWQGAGYLGGCNAYGYSF